MGFLSPKTPETPREDPELIRQREETARKAKEAKEKEEARKREESFQVASGNRGTRALTSNGFTGFPDSGRGFFTPTG